MALERKTLMQTGLVTGGARARAATRRCVCMVVQDGKERQQLVLGARSVVVGAGRDCDLVLVDPQVSRKHAELQATPEGVRVRDLGSTNGSFWQGSRLTEVVVPMGASIRIGGLMLRFAAGEVPTVPPSDRRRFGGLVGRSLGMRELFAVPELSAPTDATVLIKCETGTGIQHPAPALHASSQLAS